MKLPRLVVKTTLGLGPGLGMGPAASGARVARARKRVVQWRMQGLLWVDPGPLCPSADPPPRTFQGGKGNMP